MDTKIATVRQLFSAERRFLVPIFQRGYVWTQTGQWEPLWRDIVEQALIVRRELTRPSPASRPPRRHFLGAVVIGEDQNQILRVPTSAVIDGQQRLTTLQILLAALRDAARTVDPRVHNALAKLTTHEGDWPTKEDRFKIWPTNAYQADFTTVMTAGSVKALVDAFPQKRQGRKWVPERPRMVECYLYFAGVIEQYLRGIEIEEGSPPKPGAAPNPERLLELFEAIQTYLQLVTIELGREDDPQIIFETLNARGVELEPSDLVRNFVFLYAARTDQDPDALYEAFWKPFDQDEGPGGVSVRSSAAHLPGVGPWWRQKERQGRLTRERLDVFLFHYVTLRLNREIKIGHLFQEFRDWWEQGDTIIPRQAEPDAAATDLAIEQDSTHDEQQVPGQGTEPRSAAQELARIRRAADAFRTLLSPDLRTPLGVIASRVKRVDTTTIYPLLLWLFECRAELSEAEQVGIWRDLESYLVRRMVCGLTNKAYNTIFLNLLRKLRRSGPSRAALRRELAALTGDSSMWPDDERFTRALRATPIYQTLGPVKTQLILEALDQALEDPRAERVVHSTLTIEHIMPQSSGYTAGDAEYPLPEAVAEAIRRAGDPAQGGSPTAEAAERERARQLRWSLIHTGGNLTLVTQRLNSSVGRQPFAAKRGEITQTSRLALNAEFQRMRDDTPWDEYAITDRSARLATLACQIWPHPASGVVAPAGAVASLRTDRHGDPIAG